MRGRPQHQAAGRARRTRDGRRHLGGVSSGTPLRSEEQKPLGIEYRVASAVELPFADAAFDFATAFMSLMDIPKRNRALAEAHRVIKPAASCSSPSPTLLRHAARRNLRGDDGLTTRWKWETTSQS